MNALHPTARGREKADVAVVRHIYLDIDEDGARAVQRLLSQADLPKPNSVITSSSENRQVIWRVEGFEKDPAENLQRRLVREFGGDPATVDCARVLRLPGFYNHKYSAPQLVTVEPFHSNVYRPGHFKPYLKLEPESQGTRHPTETTTRSIRRTGPLSQSERDWDTPRRRSRVAM